MYELKVAGFKIVLSDRGDVGGRNKPNSQKRSAYRSKDSELHRRLSKS